MKELIFDYVTSGAKLELVSIMIAGILPIIIVGFPCLELLVNQIYHFFRFKIDWLSLGIIVLKPIYFKMSPAAASRCFWAYFVGDILPKESWGL
jgi:hypothetical protein